MSGQRQLQSLPRLHAQINPADQSLTCKSILHRADVHHQQRLPLGRHCARCLHRDYLVTSYHLNSSFAQSGARRWVHKHLAR